MTAAHQVDGLPISLEAPSPTSVRAPLWLEQDGAAIDDHGDCEHIATIEYLEFEIQQLCEAVAHLHASSRPVPAHLRVVVSRAMGAAELPSIGR